MRRTSAKTIWRYWYSGLTTALPINVHAQIAGIDPVKENQILDFGCGVGGQIRVMKEYFPNSQFTGCDVDPSSIDWLSKTYKEYNFVKSVASEELKLPDGSFDMIYSVSTFSHFSVQVAEFYFSELSRLVKVNGVLILTVEGISTVDTVSAEWRVPKQKILSELNKTGAFHITYDWIKSRAESNYKPLSPSVDITTYFDIDYGTTVYSADFFRIGKPTTV